MKLSVTRGHILPGVKVDDHTFLTAISTAQLFQLAPDPRLSEDVQMQEKDLHAKVISEIRVEVQRLFAGAKAKNVPGYAHYLGNVAQGQVGMAPPIVLWTKDPLDVEEDSHLGIGRIQVPYGAPLIAIDGETQLAARFEAARTLPSIQHEKVAVMVCHNRPLSWARQVFHDVNTFGIRPNATVSVAMDDRDPVTALARHLMDTVPFFRGRIHTTRRQLSKASPEVATLATLRMAALTFVGGVPAVQTGTRFDASLLPAERVAEVRTLAVQWFTALTEALGGKMSDRGTLAGSAPLFAAYGAIGHELLDLPEAQRAPVLALRIESLKAVDWARSASWSGIAGKSGPEDSFALGSTKEVIHQLVRALTEPQDAGYRRVRRAA